MKQPSQIMGKIKFFKSFYKGMKKLLFYVQLAIESMKTGFSQSHLMGLQKFYNSEQPKIKLNIIRPSISKD